MHYLVIPVADTNERCLPLLISLLESIKTGGYYDNDYHAILCYDNVGEAFQKAIIEKFLGDKIAVLDNRNPKNLNFTKNVNTGFRLAHQLGAEHITLLNMDTQMPPVAYFNRVVGEGLSFPIPIDFSKEGENTFERLLKATTGTYETTLLQSDRRKVNRYSGFCMCFSRDLVDKIGYLDERFTAGCDDDDVCIRTILAGFPCEVVSISVHHELKNRDNNNVSTTGAYDIPSLTLAVKKLKRKYRVPPQVPHEQIAAVVLDNFVWDDALRVT
jgi:GT2 family glycosyltransferase